MAYLRFSYSNWYVYPTNSMHYNNEEVLFIHHTNGLFVILEYSDIKDINELKEIIKKLTGDEEKIKEITDKEWKELFEAVKIWLKEKEEVGK